MDFPAARDSPRFVVVATEIRGGRERLFSGGFSYVAYESDGEPVALATKRGSLYVEDIPALKSEGEKLVPGRISPPNAPDLEIHFGSSGAVVSAPGGRLLIPALEPFMVESDVQGALEAGGFRVLDAYEAAPGEKGALLRRGEDLSDAGSALRLGSGDPPDWEEGECPGPPPHKVQVPVTAPFCQIHRLRVQPT
jgi:hypothetical protein